MSELKMIRLEILIEETVQNQSKKVAWLNMGTLTLCIV